MSGEKLNVLFVDDEPKIIDALRRQMRSHRDLWDVRFALGGEEALRLLAEKSADIVVSDMRMPGMTGGQLLRRVRQTHPQTTRMILSGQTDPADLLMELGNIHLYLQKPCDGQVLCDAIERSRSLARQLGHPALLLAANQITALPPAPESFRALVEELGKQEASIAKVARLIDGDPALSVKIMQLVNSAFFGLTRRVNSARDAVVLLGLKTIHAIVVAGRLFDQVSKASPQQAGISQIWEGSLAIAESASRIAVRNGADEVTIANARLAGLVSLIGRVILLTCTGERFAQATARVASSSCTYSQAEEIVYGACQDQVAAYALGLWGFSDALVEGVALQSHPIQLPAGRENALLAYVHVARATHLALPRSLCEGPALDRAFLTTHGFESLIPTDNRKAA